MRKILWLVDGEKKDVMERARYIGAEGICVRTTNPWLETSIPELKRQGLAVYAWRWPAVRHGAFTAPHYYALDEARYVVGLIHSGLDGYIADPESDAAETVNDWNNHDVAGLADQFCRTISSAGVRANKDFIFGLTSGCNYPTTKTEIPWSVFAKYTNALFPQMYWAPNIRNRHTPEDAFEVGLTSWKTIAGSSKIIPIIGEIERVRSYEILRFGDIMRQQKFSEIHLYAFSPNVSDQNWQALRDLTARRLVT